MTDEATELLPPPEMPETGGDLRIVLEHTTGVLKGIHSITGLKRDSPSPLPEMVDGVEMRDHSAPVSLVAVKRSYVLYKEIYRPEQMEGRAMPDAPFDARQL